MLAALLDILFHKRFKKKEKQQRLHKFTMYDLQKTSVYENDDNDDDDEKNGFITTKNPSNIQKSSFFPLQ